MNLKVLETLNMPPWATLKNLAIAATGASALSGVLVALQGLCLVINGLFVAFFCSLVQAMSMAVVAAFFYVFWRKAR